jgi:predicted ATPase
LPRATSPVAESEGARFQLFDAVAWLLRESGDVQPVVVVLDDLHAAGTPSLLLLQFLAGQLEGARGGCLWGSTATTTPAQIAC